MCVCVWVSESREEQSVAVEILNGLTNTLTDDEVRRRQQQQQAVMHSTKQQDATTTDIEWIHTRMSVYPIVEQTRTLLTGHKIKCFPRLSVDNPSVVSVSSRVCYGLLHDGLTLNPICQQHQPWAKRCTTHDSLQHHALSHTTTDATWLRCCGLDTVSACCCRCSGDGQYSLLHQLIFPVSNYITTIVYSKPLNNQAHTSATHSKSV